MLTVRRDATISAQGLAQNFADNSYKLAFAHHNALS